MVLGLSSSRGVEKWDIQASWIPFSFSMSKTLSISS